MRKIMMAAAAMAAFGALGLSAPTSAQAAPVNELIAALEKGEVNSDYVQYRRYYDEPGDRVVVRRYYEPGTRVVTRRYYEPRRYGTAPRYYRRDRGDALAAGALGLATGAIIGGALAQSQAQAAPVYGAQNTHSYCAQRFRSYDPASGTYLGYDGRRHPCP